MMLRTLVLCCLAVAVHAIIESPTTTTTVATTVTTTTLATTTTGLTCSDAVLQNPSFEIISDGTTAAPNDPFVLGWTRVDTKGPDNAIGSISIPAVTATDGSRYLNAGRSSLYIQKIATAAPAGATFSFTVDTHRFARSFPLGKLIFLDGDTAEATELGEFTFVPAGRNGVWATWTATLTLEAESDVFICLNSSRDVGGSELLFDNVQGTICLPAPAPSACVVKNPSFELGAPVLADLAGWTQIDILNAGDIGVTGIRGYYAGAKLMDVVDGHFFLHGGASSIFSQKVVEAAAEGTTYEVTVHVSNPTVSFATGRVYFTTSEQDGARSVPAVAELVLQNSQLLKSSTAFTKVSLPYAVETESIGKPIYLNLESNRNAGAGSVGFDLVECSGIEDTL